MTMISRGLRNNNPGNIRISAEKWQGEIQPSQDAAFKQFRDMAHGYRAMFKLLYNYQKKYGLSTIRGLIGRWAPASENHTEAYVAAVAAGVGIPADIRIETMHRDDMVKMVAAMSKVENGVPAIMADVEAGWNLFAKL